MTVMSFSLLLKMLPRPFFKCTVYAVNVNIINKYCTLLYQRNLMMPVDNGKKLYVMQNSRKLFQTLG